ncbi:MAG: riboflavin biosynthesis protein RibF [Janthinobacterium lividum]
MIVFRGLDEVPADFGPSVVTIGNFDGVHCGHQSVIREVVGRAHQRKAKAVLVTLDPHPTKVLRPEHPLRLITGLEQKLELLQATDLDAVLLLPFTADFAKTSAADFCAEILRDTLHALELHEGADFRLGHRGEADMLRLAELGKQFGFTTTIFAPLHRGLEIVSSSRIRALISAGEVGRARRLMGRPFAIDSKAASGRGYGSKYAVPTVNLAPYSDLLPANGVYVTDLRVGTGADAIHFEGVTNVGNRPTFGADSFAVETYLLRFKPFDLNEETPLRMTFLKRLREERKWPSTDALKQQIGLDVARAERWFALRRLLTSAGWNAADR